MIKLELIKWNLNPTIESVTPADKESTFRKRLLHKLSRSKIYHFLHKESNTYYYVLVPN